MAENARKRTYISVEVEPGIKRKLLQLARQQDDTKLSHVVRRALREFVNAQSPVRRPA